MRRRLTAPAHGASAAHRRKPAGTRSKQARRPGEGPGGSLRRAARAALLAVGAAVGLAAGMLAASFPIGRHGWKPLGPGLGAIRWVIVARDTAIAPPTAPDWVVTMRRKGVPWPTDLPLSPPGVTFGGNEPAIAAWFLVRPDRIEKELWHIEKASVRLTDAAGHPVPWEGGSGSALASPEEGTQLLYLRLSPEAVRRQGLAARFRLARFNGDHTREVAFELQ